MNDGGEGFQAPDERRDGAMVAETGPPRNETVPISSSLSDTPMSSLPPLDQPESARVDSRKDFASSTPSPRPSSL